MYRLTIFLRLLIASLALSCLIRPAAADLLEDDQIWGAATATGRLGAEGSPWRFWLEGQGRFGNDMSTLSQGMIRPAVGYALSDRASLWGGYAYVFTDTPFARTSFDEHRVWQQFLWTQPLGRLTATSRTRLEQRFADSGSDTGWRFRQLLKFALPLPAAPRFSLVASDEVFVNLNDVDWGPQDGFDQNRAFAGFGYAFNSKARTEVGYMNQYIDRPTNPNRMSHILGINLFVNFP